MLLGLDVKAKPSSSVLKSECVALHLIQSKPKTERSGTAAITTPRRFFVGHVIMMHSDIYALVLRSDHFRSCVSPECNNKQFTLSLCQVLV